MTISNSSQSESQYSLLKIILLWAAVALPLAFMAWVIFPLIAPAWDINPMGVGYARMGAITVGLFWEFVLALIIVRKEEGNLQWATIKRRLRLNAPLNRKTGEPSRKLWLWLIPLIILHFGAALFISGALDELSVKLLPFLAPPGEGYELGGFLASPEASTLFVGAWGMLGLFLVMSFGNIIGEEFFWRGVMLPKMNRVFGKWDGVANGVIGGAYHLSQPWQMLGGGIFMWTVFYALPAKHFRSTWVPIILHGSITIFWSFMILGLILG